MYSYNRAALLLAFAGIPVGAIRTTEVDLQAVSEDELRQQPGDPGWDPGVPIIATLAVSNDIDWSFMSDRFTYNARGSSVWGWVKRAVFDGRRRSENLKDEIAKEHYCSAHGTRDETYYAASLCYWIPDIPDPDMTQSFGLRWEGGRSNGKDLCESIPEGEGGRCVKCGVCHNNARSGSGEVTATAFIEQINLGGCKTEKQIEEIVAEGFRSDNSDLVAEHDGCVALESEHDEKVAAYQENKDQQESLNARKNSIPNELHSLELDKSYKVGQLQSYDHEVMGMRHGARMQCMMDYSHTNWWPNLDDAHYSHEDLISAMRRSVRCHGGFGDLSCQSCQNALYKIEDEYNRGNFLRDDIRLLDDQMTNLQREQSSIDGQLQQLEAAHEGLKAEAEAAEAQWATRSTGCRTSSTAYREGMAADMGKHAPGYYEESCEKACVSQKNNGCGIQEGIDVPQLGGLRDVCDPPALSWMTVPYNYVQDPRTRIEQLTDQCKRIFLEQRPAKAQSVLLEGMLWKRERLWNRWRHRYFVFESGDAVRSAMMRYWRKDPNQVPNEAERYFQGIVLWDAKRVATKPIGHYGWKDETACFKLYHFYRDYRFCVEPKDGGASVRQKWVDLIASAIVFPDLGMES